MPEFLLVACCYNIKPNRTMILDYKLIAVGHCKHPEFITIKGGKWCAKKYPALCALIKHQSYGYILYDTGYSERFFDETRKWPFSLYKRFTPVTIEKEDQIESQLTKLGISKDEISLIVLSHFHADHIGSVKDFPNAKIICSKNAFDAVKNKKGFLALQKGYLKNLLPENFLNRAEFIEDKAFISLDEKLHPFTSGYDLLGDRSLIAIELPGHAIGQMGIFFRQQPQDIFLIADSCWSSEAYKKLKSPHLITYLIHDNKNAYQTTLKKLHLLYKNNQNIKIIPSHCDEIWQEIMRDKK